MMGTMTSPLELLDQLELTKRLAGEAQTAGAAVGDISSLPKGRKVYQKRLNIFFRADPATSLAAAKKEHESKQKQYAEVSVHSSVHAFGRIFHCLRSSTKHRRRPSACGTKKSWFAQIESLDSRFLMSMPRR